VSSGLRIVQAQAKIIAAGISSMLVVGSRHTFTEGWYKMISGDDIEAFESLYGYWGSYKTRTRVLNMTPMSMVKEFSRGHSRNPKPISMLH
jgi:hypothetical protein